MAKSKLVKSALLPTSLPGPAEAVAAAPVPVAKKYAFPIIGIGASAVGLEALELFLQGGRTFHRHDGGLGLGLTISKSLVEAHGGMIRASSAGRDQGATFTVCLPMIATNLSCELAGH